MKVRIVLMLSAIVLLLGGFFAVGRLHVSAATASSEANQPGFQVSGSDLLQAGYTDVSAQPPIGVNYQTPAAYFWVGGTADRKNFTNLLMVSVYKSDTAYNEALFNYGTTQQAFMIAGGNGQESTLAYDSRIALNFSKGDYYIVIIGPDQKKVENLATLIASKI